MSDRSPDLQDLGFGGRIAQESRRRLLNRDGSFNVERKRLPFLQALSPYHTLLTISWPRFYLLLVSGYLLFNIMFAAAYYACGPGSLAGTDETSAHPVYLDDFFFSVQTSTTIGYGRIAPVSLTANMLASLEALAGLMGFALATSLMFARFSKPNARILYSRNAVVAPYRGMTGLMFRLANARNNQLIQVGVKVLLSRVERNGGASIRRFHTLSLEREEVTFLPLTWTVVHPIDIKSPLHGMTEEEFRSAESEILVLMSATDETFSQTVNSRTSYRADEVVWGAKFSDVFSQNPDGTIIVDLHRIHAFDRVPSA